MEQNNTLTEGHNMERAYWVSHPSSKLRPRRFARSPKQAASDYFRDTPEAFVVRVERLDRVYVSARFYSSTSWGHVEQSTASHYYAETNA